MRRAVLLTLSVAFLLGMYAHSAPAAHADEWCWDDPIVMIDGHVVQILTGVSGRPDDVRKKVQVAHVTIYVPAAVDAHVLKTTSTFFREDVRFVTVAGVSAEGGRDDRGNGGNNGNGGNGNGNNGKGNGNGSSASSNSRDKRPVSVTVVVTFDATALLPAMMRVQSEGGVQTDQGNTRGRLSASLVLK
jgi:hypothetical protein